jgi:hypothetical protein
MRLLISLVLAISALPLFAAPSPPANLTAVATANESITLTWTASLGATGYRVYREPDTTTPIATVGAVTTYVDSDPSLVVGTTYTYRVSAVNVADSPAESALSAPASATVAGTPSAPAGLRVTAVTSTSVSLAWNSVAGAIEYSVYRDGDLVSDVTTATFTDSGLELSTSYTYYVTVTTVGGTSEDSASVTAKTFGDGSDKLAAFAPRFRQIDINADGQLSLNEYVQGHGARLAWVVVKHRFDYSDTDLSEGLSLEEYAKALGGRKFFSPSKPRQFFLADRDEDGLLDLSEYTLTRPSRTSSTKIARAFSKLDRDGSLDLTPLEMGIRSVADPEF